MRTACHWLLWLVCGYVVSAWLVSGVGVRDDTDPPGGRSGMRLYTDRKTGCQYVGTFFSLTPRLAADGKPLCIAR